MTKLSLHSKSARVIALAFAAAATGLFAAAQQTTTKSVAHEPISKTTQTESGVVTYVSGNTLVVKRDDDGQLVTFQVPEGRTVDVGGKQVGMKDLQVGTHLTRKVTTTTTESVITAITTIKGKVWFVNPPTRVIVTTPEGNKEYKVPPGTMFDINGTKQSIFHLKKGMDVDATVVQTTPVTVVSHTRAVSGSAPPPPPPAPAPSPSGVLLMVVTATPAPAVAEAAPPPPPAALPKTGSELPLMGLLGLAFLTLGFGVRFARFGR
jgi:LPXTG-motif cell wall-anchored protein